MPRTADHDARRRQVAEALLRITASDGLEAASIPRTAQEAGVSTGLVQKYFTTKEELLRFAFGYVLDQIAQAVEAELATDADEHVGSQLFRALAVPFAPGDRPDDPHGRVWLAFLARAVVHSGLRALYVDLNDRDRERVAEALRAAQRGGEAVDGFDADAEARALLAYADGLTLHLVLEPETMTTARARAALHRYLGRIVIVDELANETGHELPDGTDYRDTSGGDITDRTVSSHSSRRQQQPHGGRLDHTR